MGINSKASKKYEILGGMNEITAPKELSEVDKAIFLVKLADSAVSATRALIHKIFADKLWEGRYSSFGEFVESGLNKSQSWASKQLAVYKHYHLEGGIAQELLELDTEKLYLAAKSEGTPEEQLARAKTLNRLELKQEANEETPHEHIPVSICRVCSIRLEG